MRNEVFLIAPGSVPVADRKLAARQLRHLRGLRREFGSIRRQLEREQARIVLDHGRLADRLCLLAGLADTLDRELALLDARISEWRTDA